MVRWTGLFFLTGGRPTELINPHAAVYGVLRELVRRGILESYMEAGNRYFRVPIGNPAEFCLEARLSQQKKRIGVRLNLIGENAAAYFHLLKEKQEDIETPFGGTLEWEELPHRKFCVVSLHKSETDPQDEDDWKNQHKWMASKLTKFDEVFRQRLQELDPADWEPLEDEDEA